MPGVRLQPPDTMVTERLQLIPATVALCQAELIGREAVARALGAAVPISWPPPVLERDDVERIHRQLASDPRARVWTLHYLLRASPGADDLPALVGVAGFGGPPSPEGEVQIGYAVALEHQGRGYATEAVTALIARAFEDPGVTVVVATTFPTLASSIGVLRKTGFMHVGDDRDTLLMRFERRRDAARPTDEAAA